MDVYAVHDHELKAVSRQGCKVYEESVYEWRASSTSISVRGNADGRYFIHWQGQSIHFSLWACRGVSEVVFHKARATILESASLNAFLYRKR